MPLCPHCQNTIVSDKDVRMTRLTSAYSKEVDLICCAVCDKIIGVD